MTTTIKDVLTLLVLYEEFQLYFLFFLLNHLHAHLLQIFHNYKVVFVFLNHFVLLKNFESYQVKVGLYYLCLQIKYLYFDVIHLKLHVEKKKKRKKVCVVPFGSIRENIIIELAWWKKKFKFHVEKKKKRKKAYLLNLKYCHQVMNKFFLKNTNKKLTV